MKIIGIIVEYNPLHNGHIHHIEETRRLSNADVLIAVMSSNFVMRGEVSIISKKERTLLALNAGIDLVIELPFVYTVQNADIFAFKAIEILNGLQIDELYFGSENTNITLYNKAAKIMDSTRYNSLLKKHLKMGKSYPTASNDSLLEIDKNISLFLSTPNNILGINYIKAINKINPNIKACTINREKSMYYDEHINNTDIQSATFIRKLMLDQKPFTNFVPNFYNDIVKDNYLTNEIFKKALSYILNSATSKDLLEIHGMNEGIENLLLKQKEFDSVEDLVSKLVSKRYTNSRIKRLLIHLVCNTKKQDIYLSSKPYIRLLGMNTIGKKYLNTIKKDSDYVFISKITNNNKILATELKTSRIIDSVGNTNRYKEEFEFPIIISLDFRKKKV